MRVRSGSPRTSSKTSGAAAAVVGVDGAVEEDPVAAEPGVAAEQPPVEAAKSFSEWFPNKGLRRKALGQFSGGPVLPKNRHVPERSCVACGAKMPKERLVRVVRTAQGSVSVDGTGRAPGRGAYLCRASECWDRAIGKGALGRSLGRDLSLQDLEQVRTYYQENIAPQAAPH